MRRNLFWLNDKQWQQIEPYLPTDERQVFWQATLEELA
jgi:hypothetical protein